MALRNRLPPWHQEITLRNGRQVLIRPIRPDDALPLRAAFPLLEPEEVRMRFLHTLKELSPEQAERFCRPDPMTEFALVAAEPYPAGEALVGAVARVSINPGTADAEFAILVSHYINGMGLGRVLMQRLARWSRGKDLHRLYGEVLESNAPMLGLAKSLGFQREDTNIPGLARVVLDLKSGQDEEELSPSMRTDSPEWDDVGQPLG